MQVYRLLADTRLHSKFSGARASISAREGGRFSVCNGRIEGVNVMLKPGERLVQAWRAKDFPAGVFSMATFVLETSKSGGTQLTLIHRGVPKALIPRTEKEWRENYWERMKAYLENA